MILERTTIVPAPLEEVFAFFADPENLARITPPSLGFVIREKPDTALKRGDRIVYTIRILGFPVRWVTAISTWEPPRTFTDTQERGPYARWVHTHTFSPRGGSVEMHDRVDYLLPFGRLGDLAAGWWVRRQLKFIFDYRGEKIRSLMSGRSSGDAGELLPPLRP